MNAVIGRSKSINFTLFCSVARAVHCTRFRPMNICLRKTGLKYTGKNMEKKFKEDFYTFE